MREGVIGTVTEGGHFNLVGVASAVHDIRQLFRYIDQVIGAKVRVTLYSPSVKPSGFDYRWKEQS